MVINGIIGAALLLAISLSPTISFAASPTSGDCENWDAKVGRLTASDRATLQSKGVLYRSGEWFFSPKLLPECTERLRMPEYFEHVIFDHPTDADMQFARTHQAALTSVLYATFPLLARSDAVPDDGDFRDAVWGLLRNSELSDLDLARILRRELEFGDGFSDSMVSLLLQHPVQEFVPDIRAVLAKEETATTENSVATAVYALAVLSRFKSEAAPIRAALVRLEQNPRATTAEKRVIPKLVAKLSAGESLEWADLEDIAFQNID